MSGNRCLTSVLLAVLVFLFLGMQVNMAGVMVVPFQVTPLEQTAHQWLGRAISYYLTAGLEVNGFKVIPDHVTTALLESQAIYFPLSITKASILRLAINAKASYVVWGEVSTSDKNQSEVLLRVFVVDMVNFSQKYLPLLRGHVDALPEIEAEALKYLMKVVSTGKRAPSSTKAKQHAVRFPEMNLSNHSYELFIKSLLIKEISRKIELLESAFKVDKGSDFLNFELARLYYEKGDFSSATVLLAKVTEKGNHLFFQQRKFFLKAMLDWAENRIEMAKQGFLRLQEDPLLGYEARHNLGVIAVGEKDYESAVKYFQEARRVQGVGSVTTWMHLIQVLIAAGQEEQALDQMVQALCLHPDNSDLLTLFPYFLSRSSEGEILFSLFRNYVPDLFMEDPPLRNAYRVISPFEYQVESAPVQVEGLEEVQGEIEIGDFDEAKERLQGLMEANPFISDYYRLMAQLFLERKEFYRAERHALAAFFLKRSQQNGQMLLKVYQSIGKDKKAALLEKEIVSLK